MPRLTENRALRAPIPTTRNEDFLYCSEVIGFCARITESGTRSWCVDYREGGTGKTKRITLGRVGILPLEGPPDEPGARDLAIAALAANRRGTDAAEAINRKKAPKGMTLNDVWAKYEEAGYPMLRGTGRKRPSTIAADKLRWAKYVEKDLGRKPVSEITTQIMQRWLAKIPSEGQRSHALVLAKSILAFSGSHGYAEPHRIDVKAKGSRQMQNFYSPEDLIALDDAAAALAFEHPHRIGVFSAIRLLLHTGARAGEIFGAKWANVNLRRGVLILDKDKASDNGREILLSDAAIEIIQNLPRYNQWVFPSDSGSGHLERVQKAWPETIERAGVRSHRLHDLRHSFASAAINSGVSLFVAGQLLGHRQATTTQRYAHLERDAAREALGKVAGAIAKPNSRDTGKPRAA